MIRSRFLRVAVALALASVALPSFAQQTGTIIGKVTDPSGAVLPGVTVEARANVLPGPRVTTSGSDGDFRLPALPPGEYTVAFNLSGMQGVTRKAQVQLALETTVNVKLSVQGMSESVEVTASVS